MTEASSPFQNIEIYTDGGCRPNPGPGAWAAIVRHEDREKVISGKSNLKTTNNRMELKAAIEALNHLNQPCNVTIYTDSQYLHQGFSEWLPKWLRNNWRSSNRKPIRNLDLWKALIKAASPHKVNWIWVAGHYGNLHNERAHRQVLAELSLLTSMNGEVVTGD